jgi:hypothetical protein
MKMKKKKELREEKERRIIIIYQMRRSGYNFHNFIHIKYDNVMIVCRSLELVFFPISYRATFGLLFFFSSPLSPAIRRWLLHNTHLVFSRERRRIPHTFLSRY